MSETTWPPRPARAGHHPYDWSMRRVEFQGDTEPIEAIDGDRWHTSAGLFELRDGTWVAL